MNSTSGPCDMRGRTHPGPAHLPRIKRLVSRSSSSRSPNIPVAHTVALPGEGHGEHWNCGAAAPHTRDYLLPGATNLCSRKPPCLLTYQDCAEPRQGLHQQDGRDRARAGDRLWALPGCSSRRAIRYGRTRQVGNSEQGGSHHVCLEGGLLRLCCSPIPFSVQVFI